jgi:hypothetical protein
MIRTKRISTKARQESFIASMLSDVPESQRGQVILAAAKGLGGSLHMAKFVICPVCGQNTLPAEYRHGIRRCRNCCYYNQQSFSPERIAETIADSLAWWTYHNRKAVA